LLRRLTCGPLYRRLLQNRTRIAAHKINDGCNQQSPNAPTGYKSATTPTSLIFNIATLTTISPLHIRNSCFTAFVS
jgi:hypothetical protein